MNIAINQHFVPQWHLKKFKTKKTGKNKKKNKDKYWIYMYQKKEAKSKEVPIKHIGQARKFYDISKKILSILNINEKIIEPSWLESEFLKDFDYKASIVINEIIKILEENQETSESLDIKYPDIIDNILDKNAKEDLLPIIVFQYLRTQKFRNELEKSSKIKLDSCVSYSHITEYLLNEERILENYHLLNEQILLIGINVTKQPLFTSDHPVVTNDLENNFLLFPNLKAKEEGKEIYFPLSPNFIVILLEKAAYQNLSSYEFSGIYLDLETVRSLNTLQVKYSNIHVYCSEDKFNDIDN